MSRKTLNRQFVPAACTISVCTSVYDAESPFAVPAIPTAVTVPEASVELIVIVASFAGVVPFSRLPSTVNVCEGP